MEDFLGEQGFFAKLNEDIPLKEFDEEASLRNQARLGKPVDKAVVDRYATAMRNGEVFPAIVAWEKSGSEPLLIVDGNHRFQAHKILGHRTIDAYLIRDAEPRAITMLTYTVNTRHGVPTDEKTRIHQGLYMMDQGISAKDAAIRLGVTATKLNAAFKLAAGDRRAEESGVDRVKWDRLSVAHRTRLNQLAIDEVFALMAKLTIDAKLPMEDLARAMSELTRLGGFQKQKEYVENLREALSPRIQTGGTLDTAGVGRQRMSPRTSYVMTLGQIGAIAPPPSIVERLTDLDKQDLATRTRDAIARLNEVLVALDS